MNKGHSAARAASPVFQTGSLLLLGLLVFGTVLLISPPLGETFPGQIPWSSNSLLRPLTRLMSLYDAFPTIRGVEIKDILFHACAALGLLMLTLRFVDRQTEIAFAMHARRPYLHAQVLLTVWVMLSFWSSAWSGDMATAWGQSALYGLALAWAIALGWTISNRELPRACTLICGATVVAAILCAWYYHFRNSAHRPSFPIGNPGTTAPFLLPGFFLLAVRLFATPLNRRSSSARAPIAAFLLLLCLIPVIYCFWLTFSRATILALLVGIVAAGVLAAGVRARWMVAAVGVLLFAAGSYWFTNLSTQDMSMARSATLRYRFYTWRYAAELWQLRPTMGQGAGSYARLVHERATQDRVLDPAAFLGETITHAHNEMFEIFSEIGLLGGVTWVGGMIATLLAGLRVAQLRRGGPLAVDALALTAAFAALLADSFASVALRLPGVPAVFYSVMGLIWACSRADERLRAAAIVDAIDAIPRKVTWRTQAVGFTIAGLMVAAAYAAVTNAWGVAHEYRAEQALAKGDYNIALEKNEVAIRNLLDPIRQLYAADREVRARFNLARRAGEAFLSQLTAARNAAQQSPPDAKAEMDHARQAEGFYKESFDAIGPAYTAATEFLSRAPGWPGGGSQVARCAEFAAELLAPVNPTEANDWLQKSFDAWTTQRVHWPTDLEATLALLRYPNTPHTAATLLRDALRAPQSAPDVWRAALVEQAQRTGFGEAVDDLLAAVAPFTPETDVDTLIRSFAPETYRLAAGFAAVDGDGLLAAARARTAALLSAPLAARLPALQSRALTEQAEFLMMVDAGHNPPAASAILQMALEKLPKIQEQQLESLAEPIRVPLVEAAFAAGQIHIARDQARHLLEAALAPDAPRPTVAEVDAALHRYIIACAARYLQARAADPDVVDRWLRRVIESDKANVDAWSWRAWIATATGADARVEPLLSEARAAGVGETDIARIRSGLRAFFEDATSQPASAPTLP